MRKQHFNMSCITLIGLILFLTLAIVTVQIVWLPLPAKAGPTLPPRDQATPIPPDKDDDDDHDKPVGTYLELQAEPGQPGLWGVVQWQDSSGGWHEVEAWRGTLNNGNNQRWWIAAKDFGTGPFRWTIYQSNNGKLLASSAAFNLPPGANETLHIVLPTKP